ncbi:MAG: alpha/beta hydrolase [Dehalococcoidales bacterium]|nr:alpha/beta hydrolase [Dehalococcoidales bacterium]
MKKYLDIPVTEPLVSLDTHITYAHVKIGGILRGLKMSLMLPAGKAAPPKPFPVLVWAAGGGFLASESDNSIPQFTYFARRGYAVASIEYRTSNLAFFPAQIEDAKAAVRFLRAHADELGLDPNRVAIAGDSAGAYIANITGVTNGIKELDVGEYLHVSSDVQAVVSYYGGFNRIRWWEHNLKRHENAVSSRTKTELLMGGTPDEKPDIYAIGNAYLYDPMKMPPYLLLYGDADDKEARKQDDEFYEMLDKAGKEPEYYIFANAVHADNIFFQSAVKDIVLDFLNRRM